MQPRPLAFVFDMDGVLVRSEGVHLAAYQAVFARRGISLTADRYRQLFGRSREQVIQAVMGQLPPGELERMMAEKGDEVIGVIAERGVDQVAGAKEFVGAVQALGLPTAVATSSRTPALFLEAIGLDGAFDVVVGRTQVQDPKPAPEAYLLAARGLGVPPESCVVIEDSPLGVTAARRAGAYVVALTTTHGAEALGEAHRVVDGFASLGDLLHRPPGPR